MAFQERGYSVTVLEEREGPGRVLSSRPPFAQYGIVHSGAFFLDNGRARACRDVYALLEKPQAQDGKVLRIFRDNSIQTGKLLVARDTEGDRKKYLEYQRLLAERNIDHALIKRDDIHRMAPGEDVISKGNTYALIRLPHVRVVHIGNYIRALEAQFIQDGGILKYRHRVSDFDVPGFHTGIMGTGVVADTPDGRQVFHASAVVNCAGNGSFAVADMAAAALRASKIHGFGATGEPPVTPCFSKSHLAVLVWNGKASGQRPYARQVSYYMGNAIPSGPDSTVGAHIYLSAPAEDGRFTTTIGPFRVQGPDQLVFTDDMLRDAQVVMPGFNAGDWDLRYAGPTCRALMSDGERDYVVSLCADPATGYLVENRHTCDTPGITAGPPLAYQSVAHIERILSAPEFSWGRSRNLFKPAPN